MRRSIGQYWPVLAQRGSLLQCYSYYSYQKCCSTKESQSIVKVVHFRKRGCQDPAPPSSATRHPHPQSSALHHLYISQDYLANTPLICPSYCCANVHKEEQQSTTTMQKQFRPLRVTGVATRRSERDFCDRSVVCWYISRVSRVSPSLFQLTLYILTTVIEH